MSKKKIIIGLLIIILISAFNVCNALFINPKQLRTREEIIKSEKIDSAFDDYIIAYFSDLNYGGVVDDKGLERVISKINDINPDVVIFGGDVVSKNTILYSASNKEKLTDFFNGIKANYTKYAVYGEKDNGGNFVKEEVENIFTNSGFEVLNNNSIKFRINTTDYINFVGIDDLISGKYSTGQAFSSVKPDTYTIAVSHSPDMVAELVGTPCSLLLSGHSLGGLVNIPIFGSVHKVNGANGFYRGSHTYQGIKVDVTDGIYPGSENLRLFTDNEIVSYKIKTAVTPKEETNKTENITEFKPNTDISNQVSESNPVEPIVIPETTDKEEKPEDSTVPENEPSSNGAIENVF